MPGWEKCLVAIVTQWNVVGGFLSVKPLKLHNYPTTPPGTTDLDQRVRTQRNCPAKMFTGQVMGGTVPKGTGKSCLIRSRLGCKTATVEIEIAKEHGCVPAPRVGVRSAGRWPKALAQATLTHAAIAPSRRQELRQTGCDHHRRRSAGPHHRRSARSRVGAIRLSAPSTIGAVEGRRDPPVSTIDGRWHRQDDNVERSLSHGGRPHAIAADAPRVSSLVSPTSWVWIACAHVLDGPLGVDRPDFNAFRALICIGKLAVGGRKP